MNLTQISEIVFLALVVWRESRGEGRKGKLAVACSVINRVDRPKWWGRTIMEVIFKRLQYTSMTWKNDPQLTTWPIDNLVWKECLEVSWAAITKSEPNPVPGADSYHDISINSPDWATPDIFVDKIGRLKFYNVDRDIERD